jgi:hypothetical protein
MQEETVNSFVLRRGRISQRSPNGFLNSESKHFMNMLFPTLSVSACFFNDQIEHHGIDKILNLHTLFPLYRPLAHPVTAIAIEQRFKGKHNRDFHALNSCFSPMEDQLSRAVYCPACFIEQVREFGFCWLKRKWLIHTIQTCTKHLCLLRSAYRDTMQGSCTDKDWEVIGDNTEDPYTDWQIQLLDASLPTFSKSLRKQLFQESVSRIISIHPNLTDNAFIERLTDRYIQTYGDNYRSGYWTDRQAVKLNRKFRCALYGEAGYYPTFAEYFGLVRLAFPNFQYFLFYLNSISVLQETEFEIPFNFQRGIGKRAVINELGVRL